MSHQAPSALSSKGTPGAARIPKTVESMPAFFVPYLLVFSLVTIVLGVLIFRQRVMAAIILLGFAVLTHVLSYFVPALNIGGVARFTMFDAVCYAIMLILTAIIVIADRRARRMPETQPS